MGARLVSEDALLRHEQDEEYNVALAADQAAEKKRRCTAEVDVGEASRPESFANVDAELHPQPREEAQQEALRRQYADEFLSAPAPVGKVARLLLRLPTGERLERTFSADAPLSRVYAWATCCALLPEARGQALSVPAQFELATSFP